MVIFCTDMHKFHLQSSRFEKFSRGETTGPLLTGRGKEGGEGKGRKGLKGSYL